MTTRIAVKCLLCSLHFNLYTWHPERHNTKTIHCPECGQQQGTYVLWVQEDVGQIFQHVPGAANLQSVRLPCHPVTLAGVREDQPSQADLEELLTLTRRHGDQEGSEAEVGDLEKLLHELWDHLAPAQRRHVKASQVVQDLLEVTKTSPGAV